MTPVEIISIAILTLSMIIIFVITLRDYTKKGVIIQKEYLRTNMAVNSILFEVRRRIGDIKKSIMETKIELSDISTKIQNNENIIGKIRENITDNIIPENITDKIPVLEKKLQSIDTQITKLTMQIGTEKKVIKNTMLLPKKSIMNKTVEKILKAMESGPKNYREIQETTGLTREHISRELKRLYDVGFLQRDELSRPYIYRLTPAKKEIATNNLNILN
jgi:DNA-binding transcriptional ArsR family regulator